MKSNGNVLLTGITGLIGGEIASLLAAEGYRIWALVRADSEVDAIDRVVARFKRSGRSVPSTVIPVCGDITRGELGIRDRGALGSIRNFCWAVVHSAGATSFRDDGICYRTNVRAAAEIIRECKVWRNHTKLFFLSTSYVCCSPQHSEITEDMPCLGYANGYIRSKRIAERRFSSSHLDTIIVRPSIVISRGINDRQFAKSILWFIPVAARLGVLPVKEESQIDIVPVDYVAACVAKLMALDVSSGCYNVTAGRLFSAKVADIAETVFRHTGKTVAFVSHRVWDDLKKRAGKNCGRLMNAVEYYTPFINTSVIYSRARIEAVLGGDMPACVPFTEYCDTFLDLIPQDEAVLESENP